MIHQKRSNQFGVIVFIFLAVTVFSSCGVDINPKYPQAISQLGSYNLSVNTNNGTLTYIGACTHTDSTVDISGNRDDNTSQAYVLEIGNGFGIKVSKGYIGTYQLNLKNQAVYRGFPTYSISDGDRWQYETDNSHTGTLVITAYDSVNQTISGTFGFIGAGSSNYYQATVMSLTNGVFTNIKLQ